MARFKEVVGNSIPKVIEELPNGCISIREEGDEVGKGLIFSVESAYDLEDALERCLGIKESTDEDEMPVQVEEGKQYILKVGARGLTATEYQP